MNLEQKSGNVMVTPLQVKQTMNNQSMRNQSYLDMRKSVQVQAKDLKNATNELYLNDNHQRDDVDDHSDRRHQDNDSDKQ